MKSFGGVPVGVVDRESTDNEMYQKPFSTSVFSFSSRKQDHTIGNLTIRILGRQLLLETGEHYARESVSTVPDINELQDSTLIPEQYVSLRVIHRYRGGALACSYGDRSYCGEPNQHSSCMPTDL